LVVETNYKLYAYTSNPLQIAVMALFASLKTRFANFVTGMITRESVRRGLENGITANQVRFTLSLFLSFFSLALEKGQADERESGLNCI